MNERFRPRVGQRHRSDEGRLDYSVRPRAVETSGNIDVGRAKSGPVERAMQTVLVRMLGPVFFLLKAAPYDPIAVMCSTQPP
jgi:hypothetical protein